MLVVCTRYGSNGAPERQPDVATRRLPTIRRGELGPAAREAGPDVQALMDVSGSTFAGR